MKPTEFASRIAEFFTSYLPGTRKVSPNTIRSYRDSFALLLRFLRDQKGIRIEKVSLDALQAPTLVEWLDHLEAERHCCPRSRNQRMAAIRSFLRYLAPSDPVRVLQLQRVLAIPACRYGLRPVPYLEPNLVAALLAQPDMSTPRGRRDAVLLSLLYDTAARSQEIIDVRVRDVRLDLPAQVSLTGKGRKTRIVPLMPPPFRGSRRAYAGQRVAAVVVFVTGLLAAYRTALAFPHNPLDADPF